MRGFARSLYCKITSLVLAVMMVVLLLACFLPIVNVRMADKPINDSFNTGRFTAGKTIPNAELGIGKLISFIKNYRIISVIIGVQNNDMLIAEENEKIADYTIKALESSSPDSYNSMIASCREKIKEYQKDNAELLEKCTAGELETIPELLNDEEFLEALAVYYGAIALFDDTQFTDEYPEYADNTIHVIIFVFGIIAFIMAVIAVVIYLFVCAVNVLIKGIPFIKRIWGADKKLIGQMYPRALGGFAGVIFCALLVLKTLNGYGVQLGSGIIIMMICYIVANAIRALSGILLSAEINWTRVVKLVVTFISVILMVFIIVSFVNVGIFATTMSDGPEFMDAHYDAVYKTEYNAKIKQCPCAKCTGTLNNENMNEVIQAGIVHVEHIEDSENYAASIAKKSANDGYKKSALIALAFDLAVAFIAAIGFICFIERLGEKKYQKKNTGELKPYGSLIAVAILLIVCFIAPNVLFGVDTVEERDAAYEDGNIKILFDDYEIEGTKANVNYQLLLKVEEEMTAQINELDVNADGYAEKKLHADRALVLVQDSIDMTQTSQDSSLFFGVALSVILLAASVVFMNAQKIGDLIQNKVEGEYEEEDGE